MASRDEKRVMGIYQNEHILVGMLHVTSIMDSKKMNHETKSGIKPMRAGHRKTVCCFFGLLFLVIASIAGADVIELTPAKDNLNLSRRLVYLEDKDGAYSPEDMIQGHVTDGWRVNEGESLNFGYKSSAFWFKGDAVNTSDSSETYLLEVGIAVLDYLDVYVVHKDRIKTWQMGDKLPFKNRPIHHRYFVVPVPLDAKEQVRIFIRVKTSGSMQLPVSFSTEDYFLEACQTENLGLSLYYGAMLVMVLYNLFVFVSVKEKTNLYYVIYVLFMTMWTASLNGTSFQYLWPESTCWNDQAIVLALNGIVLFAVLFSLGFLKIKEFYPKNGRVLLCLGSLAGLQMAFVFILTYRFNIISVMLLAVVTIVYGYGLSIARFLDGFRPARIFLVAWTMMLVGGLTMALNRFGILPRNFLTENATQIGSVLEVVLLSFAMADRLNDEKAQRVKAQELASLKEKQARLADENALKMERQARKAREETIEAHSQVTLTLQKQVEEQTRELAQTLSEANEINGYIFTSLDYAKGIQQAILMENSLPEDFFEDHFIWWEPRDSVGGDYYLLTEVEDRLLVAVGDCTGHGVPGSFMTILTHYELSRIIHEEKCFNPGQILDKLNKRIKKALKQNTAGAISDEGLDIGVCVIEKDRRHISFSGAKLDLHYIHNQAIHTVKADNQSAGYVDSDENHEYSVHQIPVLPGMIVYLYTDGIADQPGEDTGVRFGKKRLKQTILESSNQPLVRQCDGLKKVFCDYQGQRNRVDDLTMVAFRLEIS